MITKLFNDKCIFISTVLLSILLLMAIIVNFVFLKQENKFGTIDVQRIITHEAQKLASIYPKGDVPPEKLRGLIDSIQDNIQKISIDMKIILLSRTAVLSENVPDYTDSFIKELDDVPGK